MSKTATVAHSKNLRNSYGAVESTSHHLVNRPEVDNITRSKDSTGTKKSSASKQKQGYVIAENPKGSGKRNSSRHNVDVENSYSTKNAVSKSKVGYGNAEIGETAKYSNSDKLKSGDNTSTSTHPQAKVPIEQYYAEKGVDYRRLRKNCRLRVNGEDATSSRGGNLYVDSFKPPEGYTVDDLPDSQGLLSQHTENPLSPAVLIAAQPKKDRAKIHCVTPDTDPDEMIRRIQMGRRKKEVLVSTPKLVNAENVEPKTKLNDTFPDNSLNDSDLIIASQQVENEHGFAKNAPPVFKRDINGNNKDQTPPVLFASTPLPDLAKHNKPLAKETPKTTRGMSRSRNRSNGQGQTSMFETSIFDNDGENENSKSAAELDVEAAPRKLLKFDGSPIKKVNTHFQNAFDFQENENDKRVRSGEFDDDSEDELFSQMDIPGEMEIRKPSVFETSSESNSSAAATQLMNSKSDGEGGEMDSYLNLNEDDFEALAKLEAIHCTSGSSTTGSSVQTHCNPKPPPQLEVKLKNCKASVAANQPVLEKVTPRTRARRQGLSRNRAVVH